MASESKPSRFVPTRADVDVAVPLGVGDEILTVLHINGGIVIRPRIADTDSHTVQPVTEREREVLALVAEGYSNRQIGVELGISERTVKNHMTCTMTKLRASDRTHAVVTAVRHGWLAI